MLVDDNDDGDQPRILMYLEHSIQDGSRTRYGEQRTISKRMLHIEVDAELETLGQDYAPYLDYRPLGDREPTVEEIVARPECSLIGDDLEAKAVGYAVSRLVPGHLEAVRSQKLDLLSKTEAAVKERLTKEIAYWDHRAADLQMQEQAGKPNARLNSSEARRRADDLQARLQNRMDEIQRERQLSPLPPVVLGGVLVVPVGLLRKMKGEVSASAKSPDTQASAARARAAVMKVERSLGFEPVDRESDKLGYDIESRVLGTGKLRFIEVKGRIQAQQRLRSPRTRCLSP